MLPHSAIDGCTAVIASRPNASWPRIWAISAGLGAGCGVTTYPALRRAFTASLSTRSTVSESSQPMHASVMLWP